MSDLLRARRKLVIKFMCSNNRASLLGHVYDRCNRLLVNILLRLNPKMAHNWRNAMR